MISAYFLHDGTFRSAEKSLEYFAAKRTHDGKGVTIPSQIRYVHYYEKCLKKGFPKADIKLIVKCMKFTPAMPNFNPVVKIFSVGTTEVYDSSKVEKSLQPNATQDGIEIPLIQVSVKADVKVLVLDSKKKEKLFHFWFNTNMIDDYKLVLGRKELDGKARKDKSYPPNFTVEILFAADPTSPPLVLEMLAPKKTITQDPITTTTIM
jgi:phosphatidylinositol-3,4,5-trisphosphate 3-phosphatase/dual-specificity protein phosphatase PTEN